MKKINLIERLWTDSHEKQKVRGMQKYCILLLLFFTCVTHAWAETVLFFQDNIGMSGRYAYFYSGTYWDNSNGAGANKITSQCNGMTKLGSNGSKDIYVYQISDNCSQVAVMQDSQKDYENFWNTQGCAATQPTNSAEYDGYWSAANPMMIPNTSSSYTKNNGHATYYHFTWGVPTVWLKHANWDGNNWGWKQMTYNSDGTFTLDANYTNGSGFDRNCTNAASGSTYSASFTSKTPNSTWSHLARFKMTFSGNTINVSVTKLCIVTFDMNGHGSSIADKNVLYNTKVTAPSDPSATGYTFGGWYTDEGCTSAFDFANTNLTDDITLYAKWTAKNYTTSNNIKHADGTTAGQYNVNYDATSISYTTTPSKTGYNIVGLYKQAAFTNKIVNNDLSLVASTSYTTSGREWNQTSAPDLYVKWEAKTYNITLHDNNGGSNNGSATATYNGGLSSISAPTRSGYHVVGYYKEAELTNPIADDEGNLEASTDYTDGSGNWTYDGARTLYAKWESDATYYTLTYGAGSSPYNNGSVSAVNASTSAAVSSGASLLSGTEVTFTATPTNSHYKLKGWYSDASCESAIAGAGTTNPYTKAINATQAVYAGFEIKTCTITLDRNGGSSGSTSVTATHGSTLPSFTAHGRTGYTLNGYYTETSGGTKIINADGSLVASTSYANSSKQWNSDATSLTLHAQWTENKSTVTVMTNNTSWGSLKFGETSKDWGTTASVGVSTTQSIKATANSGYIFDRWELSGGAATASSLTSATITLKGDGTGDAGTAKAVFGIEYYYRGDKNSNSATLMTCHESGLYAYYSTSGTHKFKVAASTSSWDYDFSKVDNSLGNITLTNANDGYNNAYCPETGSHYIMIFYPSTSVNTSANPVIAAATELYDISRATLTLNSPSESRQTLMYAGDVLPISVTAGNLNNDMTGLTFSYQYKVGDGDWQTLTPTSSSASSPDASCTWTTPSETSNKEYYVRGKLTYTYNAEIKTVYSASSGKLTVIGSSSGSKTIKVKKSPAGWVTFDGMYLWSSDIDSPDWPGYAIVVNHLGGKWYELTIPSACTNFVLNNGVADSKNGPDKHQTVDLTYESSIANNSCYNLTDDSNSESDGQKTYKYNLESTDCPSAPTVSTAEASSIVNISATLGGSISSNGNDAVTSYGYYYSTNSGLSSSNLGVGTRVEVGTDDKSGSYTKSQASLTANTTYYVIAYATNGIGTGYGDVENFTTPYKVTITNPAVGGSFSTTGVQYVTSTLDVECTAATGYTFSSWTTNDKCEMSSTTTTDGVTTATLTPTADGATLTAVYTEDMHTVTLNSSVSGGHVEISSETVTSTSAGIATASPTITAVADSGYYFTGWTGNIGSGVTIASGSTSTASITIRATADSKSITANFAKRWVLAGEWLKVGENWDVTTNVMNVGKISNTTFVSKQITGLAANTEYKFKLYDNTSGDHWVGYATSGQVYAYPNEHDSIVVNTYGASGHDITLKTAAQGDYYFYYNLKNHKLNISIPASRQVTMGTRTISNGITSAYTGGTISAEDERDNVITNGLYIKSGDDITFTASPRAGYIWRGWYNSSGCTGAPVATERVHTDENVTAVGFQRYALFEEALYTVTVHRSDVIETTVKVGVDTKPAITASTAPTGKVFDRWVTTGSATVADPYSSTTTITGATDNVSTVTATFKELPKIYIDLTSATGWTPSNMYVVFYKNNGYFDENNGTGLSSTYVINATPLEMTKMGTSKIWYYAYDPTSGDFEGQTITCVAFVDHTFAANYGNFTSATAVYRTDFSSCMNMFVLTDNTGVNKNTTCHYRNTNAISGHDTKGYWRKYEEKNSGFYLNNLPGGSVEFTNEDGGNSYTAVANLDANTNYYFYLGGCNGWNWSNKDDAFNSNNRTRELVPYGDVSSDGLRCHLTTTAAGYYTFTLTPLNTGRKVQVSVAFPVAANDYRAVYNNAASSPTIKRPSNIIKNDQNSGTISLWLNKGTNYISFQKAAVAVGGAVSWSACGSQQTVSDVPEAGIYNMTLTRDGSTYTVSTPEKYEGGLYIRTDCAPGKWADYTENKLTENTFNFDPDDDDTYDYYYCKWINDAGTNVRCVIANDYNVAISDTLKTEAILGGGETLPEGANVRFSYNSVTNELKRSYLTGASTDVFLNIMPDAASTVYKTDGTTDMYNGGVVGARNKFSDLGNWVYEMDVKVYPGATASVQANYNSTQQPLIAAGTTLLGGTEEVLYQIRLIYDFRTNYLMSAWMPSGTVDEAITLNSDMMIVRRAQNQANKLSFDEGGKLDKVKRAYGVFEFHKADMVNHMSSWSDFGYTYGQCMYYFSLPFDVNVSDIFGVGTMGDDWRLQFYNGTKRAEKGWFAGDGTTTFWEDVPADTVLHAYEGYCLMLNRSHFNNGSHAVWNNVTTDAYLYFPSVAPVAALKDNEMEITVPSHECKIDRFFDQDKAEYYDPSTKTWKKGARNHKYVDSHWNLMGTPLFEDATADALTACKVTIGDADSTLNYIYEWVPSTNSLSARQVLNTDFTFKPMYAYMVQYSGKVTFTGASITPASIAARRTSENKQYTIDLLLTKEDQFAGRTYVELRENAVDSFMLNEDMYMMKGSKIGDIYTHADGYELAANVLSVNSHIVPVSIDAKAAGTYTISMPSNFSGTVTLIDKYAQTRTNLAFEDYEIYLEKGTIADRFELEININKTPTAIDGVEGGSLKDGKAHKFIMNDMLYILKDGVLFDARGNRVK